MAEIARRAGWTVESLDYQGMADPLARVDKLVAWCRNRPDPAVLVGSSMGGFVALAAAARAGARGLFLLAPALYMPGYEDFMPDPPDCPTVIVHGWRDDIVPWKGSVRYGDETGARLIMLEGDHRLTANLAEIEILLGQFLTELDSDAAYEGEA